MMNNRKGCLAITHQNIYQMLMYVYPDLYDETLEEQEDFFEHLDDLMADLLMLGITRQLRRGLYKEYVRHEEPLTMIRGKVDVHQSIKLKTQLSRQLYCEFDEFDKDNLYNQILKATCLYLIQQGKVNRSRRKKLRDLLLSFHEVREVSLRTITWESIRFHKDKIAYRSLIGLCYMIYKGLCEEEETEETYLHPVVMADLYERFIQHFYQEEWPMIKQSYQGKYNSGSEDSVQLRNILTVDMLLTHKDYRLIINTHYFDNLVEKEAIMGQGDFIDQQLTRLLGTIKRNAFNAEGVVEGMLLYPTIGSCYMECYEMEDRRLYLGALDLTGPFEEIKGYLMDIGEDIVAHATL